MIRISDLPKELQDAIYIEDCHVSGMHDPEHTETRICDIQLCDLARRILKVLDIDLAQDTVEEMNKIPRRLRRKGQNSFSWYQYYIEHPQYKRKAKALEQWEKKGFTKEEAVHEK